MGNYIETKEEVKNHLYARVPLIVIKSSERERVERMFQEIATETRTQIYFYTDVKQVVSLSGNAKKDVDRDPMMFVQDLFRRNRGSTFVIGDARRLGEENAYSREILDTLYLAMETASGLISEAKTSMRISRFSSARASSLASFKIPCGAHAQLAKSKSRLIPGAI